MSEIKTERAYILGTVYIVDNFLNFFAWTIKTLPIRCEKKETIYKTRNNLQKWICRYKK